MTTTKNNLSEFDKRLRKYKNRPAQTLIQGIGWVRNTELSNPTILDEIERIRKRNLRRKTRGKNGI